MSLGNLIPAILWSKDKEFWACCYFMLMVLERARKLMMGARFNPVKVTSSYLNTSSELVARVRVRLIESSKNSL